MNKTQLKTTRYRGFYIHNSHIGILAFLALMYMSVFPLVMFYAIITEYGVIIPLLVGTACTALIIISSLTSGPPPDTMIKTADGKPAKRCWRCASTSVKVFPFIIVSVVSMGILYVMELVNPITHNDMIQSIVLSVLCSMFVYVSILRAIYPETAKPCMHDGSRDLK